VSPLTNYFALRRYLCHVWCLVPFLPEAQETMGKVHVWMKERVWA
jgi:hypothetical protein